MAWNWTRLGENAQDPNVERQLHEDGCGAACVVMLLRDREVAADQLVVSAKLHMPSTAQELSLRLNEFSAGRHSWVGGHLDIDGPLGSALLEALGRNGSWAALLLPERSRLGHWVVVDRAAERSVAVRDPVGSSYGIPEAEFLAAMRYTVAVFEKGK